VTDLRGVLEKYVDDGSLPGAVAVVARDDQLEVVTVGSAGFDVSASMARDSIFRIASLTKPITTAAVWMTAHSWCR
jgi:CubicO group peptidase (beta-lactamase class C family)